MRTAPVLDRDEAERLLDPVKALFVSETHGAFEDWAAILGRSPEQTSGLTKRTRRNFIHDRIVFRLRVAQASGAYPMLQVKEVQGLIFAEISNRLVLKLKRLDDKYRSRNIATGQTLSFNNQEPLLATVDPVTNATHGYVLDEAEAEPVHIVAVCWEGEKQHWVIDMDDSQGSVFEFTAEPAPDQPSPTGTRVVTPRQPKVKPGERG